MASLQDVEKFGDVAGQTQQDECKVEVPSLTVVVRGQVDGFGPDRSQVRRHFQPQLVAVGLQRPDGAQSLPGVELLARGALVAHALARSVLLLHHIAGQVSPPAPEIQGNRIKTVSTLMLSTGFYNTWPEFFYFFF